MIGLKDIKELHTRRYNLINSALEIFTSYGRSYLFNFYTNFLQLEFIKRLKSKSDDINCITDNKQAFENGNFTLKWSKGELSNFEYLLIVNTYAGRSYNDIN